MPSDALGGTQEEIAARVQSEVKHGQHALLDRRFQVDQHVSATHEIQLRERRIADDVLHGEHDRLANGFSDGVAMVVPP